MADELLKPAAEGRARRRAHPQSPKRLILNPLALMHEPIGMVGSCRTYNKWWARK